jgi:glucose 1-dehydrogenase
VTGSLLAKRVAIVTGGSSGIGKAISIALAEAGADVTINYRANRQGAEDTLEQVERVGARAHTLQGDVSCVDDIQRLIDQTVAAFGRLDVMINNAGMETRTSVLETTESQFDHVLDVNLKSAFFGTQLAAKQMIAQGGGGRIINISSVHEVWPMPGNVAYCCSKGGIRMLTATAGVELAPYGITVVGVGPGAIATPINAASRNDADEHAALLSAIPLGRIGSPQEVADLVVWLASDHSRYMTATTAFIDGGLMQASVGL